MNRSQRCGVCRGCQSKPCGHCVYCQDSPQFGGPGVKKQSCIERRCLRVLENRLQRDGPTFKAKAGCQGCDECMSPDCQVCLVCLDRKFFDNRYLPGAMCAKKRCNQSRTLELPYLGPPPGVVPAQDVHHGGQHPHHLHLVPHPPPIAPHPVHLMDGVYASVFHNGAHHYLTGPPASPGGNKRMSPSDPSDSPRKQRKPTEASPPTAATLLAAAGPVPINGAVSVAISHHPIIQTQCIPGGTLWTPQRVSLSSSPQVVSALSAPTHNQVTSSVPSPTPQYMTPGANNSCHMTALSSNDPYAYRPLGFVDVNHNPDVKQEQHNNHMNQLNNQHSNDVHQHHHAQTVYRLATPWQDYASLTAPSAVLGAAEHLIPPSLSGKHQVVLQPL